MPYKVNDIHPCIQGEGALTGIPMMLIRLQGCSVACPWCDTRETWACSEENRTALDKAMGANPKWFRATPEELLAHMNENHPKLRWILLTGGEPAEQELGPLVSELKRAGHRVALETSGTASGHLDAPLDWICVSPKFDMPGGREVLPVCLESAHEIKHVVGRPEHIRRLDTALEHLRLREDAIISLQPVSLSRNATELCVETVIRRGWRLSLQTHKMISQK